MSFCISGPSPGPNRANLMEWVEQQAVHLQGPPKASPANQGMAPVSESSIAAPSQELPAKLNPNLSLSSAKLRVYDIPTLYALRKEAARKNIELKIHTTALKGRRLTHLQMFWVFLVFIRRTRLHFSMCFVYIVHLLDLPDICEDQI